MPDIIQKPGRSTRATPRGIQRHRCALALLILLTASALARDEDPAVREVDVVIHGIDGALRDNVRAMLEIAELEARGVIARLDPRPGAPGVSYRELERLHRAAPNQIRQALMPFGYYLPEIESELDTTRNGYVARYVIDPGPPALLRNVDVRAVGEGADMADVQQAIAVARRALEPGTRLSHPVYRSARERIFDAAYDRGFLRARWQRREVRVLPDRETVDIHLVLDTGPRYYFGDVTIEAEQLRSEFTQRFVEIEPGEPYDVRRLLSLQLVLNDAEYFRYVEVQGTPEDADEWHRIPINIVTQPAPSQHYTASVGYATDTGPRLSAGVLLRRVNDRGHQLRSDVQLSLIDNAFAARYEIPIRRVATDRLDFAASARRLDIADVVSVQYAASASEHVEWRGFSRRLYLQIQREDFDLGVLPTQTVHLLYPGVTLTRQRADDMIYPRRGYSVQFDLRGTSDVVFSDLSFLRIRADANWVHGLTDRTRLVLRAEAGATSTDDYPQLPPTQRFYAGGDRSVRGYHYQGIGVQDREGNVIGGQYLLVGSVELDHLFYGDFGTAAFVDVGDAFRTSFSARVGAGVGLRWRSPIGMARLDVAHPFHRGTNFRIHFSIGTDL
jgi:translocation and assembly module TamA